MLKTGVRLLRSRYKLVAGPVLDETISQAWLGVDEDDSRFLIKVWPFDGDRPDDLQRALWDAELRTLYRVGSSPGADDAILVIRDAGVDKDAHCFAMVLEAPGYEPLANAIRERTRIPWLQTREIQTRRSLWSGLENLVDGIVLLHEQHILHRDLRPETIYFSSDLGPSSLRLGGFEWSVRLGRPATKVPPPGWSSPPEFFQRGSYGYRPETDWFGFGMLAARLLLNVESYSGNEPVERHARVLAELERPANRLADIERALLRRLIALDPRDRLSRGYDAHSNEVARSHKTLAHWSLW
jgi:serine/threonine protein kinase